MTNELIIALVLTGIALYSAVRTIWFTQKKINSDVPGYLQDCSYVKILLYFWNWNFEKLFYTVYKQIGDE